MRLNLSPSWNSAFFRILNRISIDAQAAALEKFKFIFQPENEQATENTELKSFGESAAKLLAPLRHTALFRDTTHPRYVCDTVDRHFLLAMQSFAILNSSGEEKAQLKYKSHWEAAGGWEKAGEKRGRSNGGVYHSLHKSHYTQLSSQPVCARVLVGGKYKHALLNPLISTWLLVSANGVPGNQRAPGTCFQIRGIVPGTKEEQLEEETPKEHK